MLSITQTDSHILASLLEYLYLRGEHGDVVKVSTSSLLHRDRQEEAAGVSWEERFLVLKQRTSSGTPDALNSCDWRSLCKHLVEIHLFWEPNFWCFFMSLKRNMTIIIISVCECVCEWLCKCLCMCESLCMWVCVCTLMQAPVVESQTVRIETFCARFNQRTAVLVLLIHFTITT